MKKPRPTEFPDRACASRSSEHYYEYARKIGVKLDGRVLMDVHEYCVSEGWVRGFKRNERGRIEVTRQLENGVVREYPLFVQESGHVELYWR